MGQSTIPPAAALSRRLLLMADRTTGGPYVRALERATIAVQWVHTIADLDVATRQSEEPIPALVLVVASQDERLDPSTFADIAMRLFPEAVTETRELPANTEGWREHLYEAFRAYCAYRALSPRQERVLAFYLTGSNDKEMADVFGCSEATVYEHWRRMARKASGVHKWDVVTDFHRFLAGAAATDPKSSAP